MFWKLKIQQTEKKQKTQQKKKKKKKKKKMRNKFPFNNLMRTLEN